MQDWDAHMSHCCQVLSTRYDRIRSRGKSTDSGLLFSRAELQAEGCRKTPSAKTGPEKNILTLMGSWAMQTNSHKNIYMQL